MTKMLKDKQKEKYLIQVIRDWDLYPSEMNHIYKLQQKRNLYWKDIDLSGTLYDVSDEDFAKVKEIVQMGEEVSSVVWTVDKITKDWETSRYFNKAKEITRIWDDATIELLENFIEIDFDLLKERVDNYRA